MAIIIKICKQIVEGFGTLANFFIKDDRAHSVVRSKEEDIGEEAPPSCSQAVTSRRERLELLRSHCGSEVEYEIKKSMEHWTQVPRRSTVNRPMSTESRPVSTDEELVQMANSERFKRLMDQWRSPNSEYGFFLDYGELLMMGPKIAEGGQAEIFDARFEGDDREFVLKVFKEDTSLADLERLWPPAMLPLLHVDYQPHWMLTEPHCCWIRGGTLLKDGRFAFLMDKYSGGDLRTFIDQRMQERNHRGSVRSMPFAEYVEIDIMLQIAEGMQSLHKRGILHRDLKASNVLLKKIYSASFGEGSEASFGSWPNDKYDFEFVVADFETSVGVLGTGFWRAPEVLLALKNRDFQPEIWTQKVDVYSYAMTCYEVITGHIPFENLKGNDYDFVIRGGRPSFPFKDDDIPKWRRKLRKLVARCWDSEPSNRPDFVEIVRILEEIIRVY